MVGNKDYYKDNMSNNAEKLVYALVITLVFEGLLRKLLPSGFGLIIFFFKDVLCLISFFLILKRYFTGKMLTLLKAWRAIFVAFIPVFFATIFHDPFLGFFGLKQYLLYVVAGLLVPVAFPPGKIDHFKKFISLFIFLLIPTTLVAILQNSLPGSHWLNRSVDGGSLEGFAAAGYLRVSSTFSFTGQYSWFLNIASGFLAGSFFFPEKPIFKAAKYLSITGVLCLLVGTFITGGRTAVLGTALSLLIGSVFSSLKAPKIFLIKGVTAFVLCFLLLGVVRAAKPEFFAAYDQRSSGSEEKSHSAEIEDRVFGDFFSWTNWLFIDDTIPMLFGNGIGVMSNGSEKISVYANEAKNKSGGGLESDYDVTAWEGGIYLMLVWYGFRVWIIVFSIDMWKEITSKKVGLAVSFLLGFIIVTCCYGAVSKQAPISLWLWLSVGCIITLLNYDKSRKINSQRIAIAELPEYFL
ncbi:hypothetical protein [Mucilaginibacter polytrichastri]|uniref:Uncharacterized protein n=1 Tax=Mucilaginibacter polytrichastri TaxID=1302689 RepID=A0A1Q5ZTQ1_9SPHI|nr:hypothetical protein [Mucilaginibacter polytrichastri]OKS85144.1 hypothetical protein RG47T_0588 [Mucilaginibacter polytrichastri]SFS43821.1 hypothetical protein SAMN04487890_101496 [Mucilaginibacter polytrichastri]